MNVSENLGNIKKLKVCFLDGATLYKNSTYSPVCSGIFKPLQMAEYKDVVLKWIWFMLSSFPIFQELTI